jgi:hypothetical protein
LYQNYTAAYQHDMALAHDGVWHLQTAKILLQHLAQGSLDAHSTAQARQEFAAAFRDFSQIKNDLEQVPGISTSVPKFGSLLSTALKLVLLANEISRAGMVGCDALTIVISHLHEPLDARSQGITMNDLAIIRRNVAEVQGLLNTAADQVNQLRSADLQADSRIGPTVATFRAELPKLQTGLQDAQIVLSAAPALLGIGQPASIMRPLSSPWRASDDGGTPVATPSILNRRSC